MTPNRERIEEKLSEADRKSIRDLARRIQLHDLDEWPTHKLFAGWLHLAVGEAVDEALRKGRARSFTRAQELVCAYFGVSTVAVQRRERRARKDRGQNVRHDEPDAA